MFDCREALTGEDLKADKKSLFPSSFDVRNLSSWSSSGQNGPEPTEVPFCSRWEIDINNILAFSGKNAMLYDVKELIHACSSFYIIITQRKRK